MPAISISSAGVARAATSNEVKDLRQEAEQALELRTDGQGSTITIAATRRCLSATRRHRAARHSAPSIHISRARKSPGNDIIGGILASTKYDLAAASVSVPIGAAPLARERVLGIDPAIGVSTARGGHALGVAGELAIAGIAPWAPLQAVAILCGLASVAATTATAATSQRHRWRNQANGRNC